MPEYIKRDEAVKKILDAYEREFPTASGAFDEFVTRIIPNIIMGVESSDVAPVVHGRWIPCSERLPELPDGKWCERAVIVCAGDRVMPMVYARSIVRGKAVERWKWVWDQIYDSPQAITHWMPLPGAPDEKVLEAMKND